MVRSHLSIPFPRVWIIRESDRNMRISMIQDVQNMYLSLIHIFGTVKVEKYLCVERFSHVMHLGSTVTGIIRDDKDAVDAVDAILPAGKMCIRDSCRNCR